MRLNLDDLIIKMELSRSMISTVVHPKIHPIYLSLSLSLTSPAFDLVGYMLTKKAAKLILQFGLPARQPIDDQMAFVLRHKKMHAYMVRYVNVEHLGALTNNDKDIGGVHRWKSNIWGSKFKKQH